MIEMSGTSTFPQAAQEVIPLRSKRTPSCLQFVIGGGGCWCRGGPMFGSGYETIWSGPPPVVKSTTAPGGRIGMSKYVGTASDGGGSHHRHSPSGLNS